MPHVNQNPDPPALQKGDSAVAALLASQAVLQGHHFDPFPQSPTMQFMAGLINQFPEAVRIKAIDRISASMGHPPKFIAEINPDVSAEWVTSGYSAEKYPGCILGAPGLAVAFLSGITGFPFLPQPLLYNARFDLHPDDSQACLDAGKKLAEPLTRKYPDIEAIIHFDPVHDRFLISRVVFIRLKYLRLPEAYRKFIKERVVPGGSIILVDCDYPWPMAEVSERLYFQLGGLGDIAARDYLDETPELRKYRAAWGAPKDARWKIDAEFVDRPESEWGCVGAFLDDADEIARGKGFDVVRYRHSHPIELSKAVFKLYEKCRADNLKNRDVYICTFTHTDPQFSIATGATPLWLPFITRDNLKFAEDILGTWSASNKINRDNSRAYVTLHPSFCSPPDLVPLKSWQELLGRYFNDVQLLGINPRKYPTDIASYVSMYPAVVEAAGRIKFAGRPFRSPTSDEIEDILRTG